VTEINLSLESGCYRIDDKRTQIGRHCSCNIVMADVSVSGVHAEVLHERDHFELVDLGSKLESIMTVTANDWLETCRPAPPDRKAGVGKKNCVVSIFQGSGILWLVAPLLLASLACGSAPAAQDVSQIALMLASVSAPEERDFRNPFLEALTDDPKVKETESRNPRQPAEETELPGTTPDDLHNLRVYLHDVRAPSIGLTTASINYVIHVSNPNDRVIKGPVLVYEGFIGDVGISVGRTFIPDIPAQGHRRYQSGFIVSYIDLGRSLVEAIREREFSFRIEGTITSEGQEARFATTFEVRREAL